MPLEIFMDQHRLPQQLRWGCVEIDGAHQLPLLRFSCGESEYLGGHLDLTLFGRKKHDDGEPDPLVDITMYRLPDQQESLDDNLGFFERRQGKKSGLRKGVTFKPEMLCLEPVPPGWQHDAFLGGGCDIIHVYRSDGAAAIVRYFSRVSLLEQELFRLTNRKLRIVEGQWITDVPLCEPLGMESLSLALHEAWVELHKAHAARNRAAVVSLLKRHPQLDQTLPTNGSSWLHMAVEADSVELAKLWLDKGQEVNKACGRDSELNFSSPLLRATSVEMLQLLLSRGADVNARDRVGTALHRCRKPEQVRLLLDAGADPSIVDSEGVTPLRKQQSFRRDDCARLLIEAGAPVEGKPLAKPPGQIAGTVIVDIRNDMPDFLAYVRKRVADHVKTIGKRRDDGSVRMIEFGFEFGQANWVAIAFDTRPDAEPDGEWSGMLRKKDFLYRPKWPIWEKLADDAKVYFMNLAGKKVNVMKDPDTMICRIVGEALKQTLLTAREQGVFDALPKAERCELGVENLEGFYGWPKYEDRGKENLV